MRIVFAGTPPFAAQALAALLDAGHDLALVLTQPDRPAGRGMNPAASAVKQLALLHRLEVFQPASLREPAALERLRAAAPEVLVVAAYGLILPSSVLDLARWGALNIHAALLPRWRGAAPIQRAILAGDRETGITIMQMDEGLDTGAILAQRSVPISPSDDAQTLHDTLAALGAAMIEESLQDIGRLRGAPQPAEGVTYAHKIAKSEAVLDWRKSSTDLGRVVRAFNPSPGARATLGEEPVKIWRAHEGEASGTPGVVLACGDAGIEVACGQGALVLAELQRAGAKRLSAREFLHGSALVPGARFALR